ncbi:MAG: HK97 family phage prohead protease [Candidatus Microthrix sp.]|nr:HK97 family phage prohead protease [Candidatus Microthrix sp.]
MNPDLDLRNLPSQVLARLDGLTERDLRDAGIAVRQRGQLLEARSSKVEIRVDDNGDALIDGYATVYEYPYDVAGGPPWGWTETIAEGAAAKSVVERDDVKLLFDHTGIPLARTQSKTLTLTSDTVGLAVAGSMSMKLPSVQDVVGAMERGDLDEMSFAFRVVRQEWNSDYTDRRILEVKLFDVSVVTFPANPATVAQLRNDTPTPAPPGGMPLSLARAHADRSRALTRS